MDPPSFPEYTAAAAVHLLLYPMRHLEVVNYCFGENILYPVGFLEHSKRLRVTAIEHSSFVKTFISLIPHSILFASNPLSPPSST